MSSLPNSSPLLSGGFIPALVLPDTPTRNKRASSKSAIAKHRSLNLQDYQVSFQAIAETEQVRQMVFEQLKQELNNESLDFFQAVQTFKQHKSVMDVKYIFKTFIALLSPKEINISQAIRNHIIAEFDRTKQLEQSILVVPDNIFDKAEEQLFSNAKEDVLENAQKTLKWEKIVKEVEFAAKFSKKKRNIGDFRLCSNLLKLLLAPRFINALTEKISEEEGQKLAEMIVKFTKPVKATLACLYACFELEFSTVPFSVFAEDELTVALMHAHVAQLNHMILTNVLDISFAAALVQIATTTIPREVRAVIYFLRKAGAKYGCKFEETVLPVATRFLVKFLKFDKFAAQFEALADIQVQQVKGIEDVAAARSAFIQCITDLQTDPEGKNFDDLRYPFIDEFVDADPDVLRWFHKVLYAHGYEMVVSLTNDHEFVNRRPVTLVSCFLSLLSDFGPLHPEQDAKNEALSKSMEFLVKHINILDLTAFENAKYFYVANATKKDIPVLYLVLQRLTKELAEETGALMVHVHKVLSNTLFTAKFVLVIDLSFSSADSEYFATLKHLAMNLTNFLRTEFFWNCKQLYIVHQSGKNEKKIKDIITTCLNEYDQEHLVKIYTEWTQLYEDIEQQDIGLPCLSRTFIPTCQTIHTLEFNKLNEGPQKIRKIRVTNDAVIIYKLNGDLRFEILIKNLKEVVVIGSQVSLTYNQPTAENKSNNVFKRLSLSVTPSAKNLGSMKKDAETVRVTFPSDQEKEYFMDQVFLASVSTYDMPQTFTVEKMKKKSRKKCTLRITRDSIFVMEAKPIKIKKEIPFSTLHSFYIDELNAKQVVLNFSIGGKKKVYTFLMDNVNTFKDSLFTCHGKFKTRIRLLKHLPFVKAIDPLLEKFLSNFFKIPTDHNYQTRELRIFQVVVDVHYLLSEFGLKDSVGVPCKYQVETIKHGLYDHLGLVFEMPQVVQLLKQLDRDDKGFITLNDLLNLYEIMSIQTAMKAFKMLY